MASARLHLHRLAAAVGLLLSTGLIASLPSRSAFALDDVDLATVSTASGVLRRVYGSTGNGAFGVPIAGGLDCDGDGLVDYAMASMLADPDGRNDAGIVYLVFGDQTISGTIDTATPHQNVLRIYGDGTREMTGSEIWMDDVTGDGLGDLLIARQNYGLGGARPGAGSLTIVAGSAQLRTLAEAGGVLDLRSPPQEVALTILVGAAIVDRLGIWVRTGDVTGDAIADVVVGADQVDIGAASDGGTVYLVRGGSHLVGAGVVDLADFGAAGLGTGLDPHVARIRPPAASEEFHFGATCQIADLDGNGRGEVLAAATINRAGASIDADGAPAGSAHAVGGVPDGRLFIVWDDNIPSGDWPAGFTIDFDSAPGTTTTILGGTPSVSFGEEILGGRDFDADGHPDLFVGDIVGDWTGGRLASGSGHVIYGADQLRGLTFAVDALPQGVTATLLRGGRGGDLAADTAMQGDFDGDGIDDLAFSSPHASPLGRFHAGAIHVFFGRSGGWPPDIDLAFGALPPTDQARITQLLGAAGGEGLDDGDTLCYSGAAGDVDGDGRDDILTNEMQGNGVLPAAVDVGNLLVISGDLIAAGAAVPRCAQPISSGATPIASDCLVILQVAVSLRTCTPEDCVCAPKGTLPASATDALICLKKVTGQNVSLDCPCTSATTAASRYTAAADPRS